MSATAANPNTPAHRTRGDFRTFWLGQTVSNLGSSFTAFAIPLLVFRLTGSALNLAIASALTLLPVVLFGLHIGAWVDRVNRKRLMIGADLGRAIVVATVPLLAALQLLSIWWIYAVGFMTTTLALCFSFAQVTAIASLVAPTDLVTANGRIHASMSATGVLGPILAGLLAAVLPLPTLLLLDSCSFLISACTLARVRTSFNLEAAVTPSRLRQSISEGLHYLLRHPVLRSIAAIAALTNLVVVNIGTQVVVYGTEHLHLRDAQLGFLYAAQSSGVIVLALAAGYLRKHLPFSTVALGAIIVYGLLTIALALTHTVWIALLLLAVTSGLIALFSINVISLRQAPVPNELLGRVTSTLNVVASAATPLGVLLGGAAIEQTQDVGLVFGTIGVIVCFIGIGFTFTPLGRAEQYLPSVEM